MNARRKYQRKEAAYREILVRLLPLSLTATWRRDDIEHFNLSHVGSAEGRANKLASVDPPQLIGELARLTAWSVVLVDDRVMRVMDQLWLDFAQAQDKHRDADALGPGGAHEFEEALAMEARAFRKAHDDIVALARSDLGYKRKWSLRG